MITFYVSGTIQGSNNDNEIANQDYRVSIKTIIKKHFPDARILCPLDMFPNLTPEVVITQPEWSGSAFNEMVKQARESDVIVCYLSEASMGSAVEMWEAHLANKPVLVISKMDRNLMVRSVASALFRNLSEFDTELDNGLLKELKI